MNCKWAKSSSKVKKFGQCELIFLEIKKTFVSQLLSYTLFSFSVSLIFMINKGGIKPPFLLSYKNDQLLCFPFTVSVIFNIDTSEA